MKIKSVNPGNVHHVPKGFQFSIVIDGIESRNAKIYKSVDACEQAMRETVHLLRKQNLV